MFDSGVHISGATSKGAAVNTVVVRFHHPSRDIGQIESDLVRAGARDARVTGYTVALDFGEASKESAVEAARHALDQIGATRIKVRYPKRSRPQQRLDAAGPAIAESEGPTDTRSEAELANLMARIEMGVFGHP